MIVKEQKFYKWYKIKEKAMSADATVTPMGLCKVIFESLSPQNKIYFGEIGYRKIREITKILNKIADIAEEQANKLD